MYNVFVDNSTFTPFGKTKLSGDWHLFGYSPEGNLKLLDILEWEMKTTAKKNVDVAVCERISNTHEEHK